MDNLKIKITNDAARVLGEVSFGDSYCLDASALKNLCESLMALYPSDPVNLEIRFSLSNN